MKRIECKFSPGAGQLEFPSGNMSEDVPVEFHWITPRLGDANKGFFDPDKVKNGNVFIVAPSNNNCGFTGEFKTFPAGTGGTLKGGFAASSFSWNFKKAFELHPDTEYSVVVTADADCAGFKCKLNAGPD
jgi:hypothetical protein